MTQRRWSYLGCESLPGGGGPAGGSCRLRRASGGGTAGALLYPFLYAAII